MNAEKSQAIENLENLKAIITAQPKAGWGYDSELLTFVEFLAGTFCIRNIFSIYTILNTCKSELEYCLQDEYDNFYTERCSFEYYKENFVELLMQDLFIKCYDTDFIESYDFYLNYKEELTEETLYKVKLYFKNEIETLLS